jgi:hypothetical protein
MEIGGAVESIDCIYVEPVPGHPLLKPLVTRFIRVQMAFSASYSIIFRFPPFS